MFGMVTNAAGSKRLPTLTILLFAAAGLALIARRYGSLEELVARERDVRALIERSPAKAVLIALAVYVLLSLVPGTSGKAIVAGWLFGHWLGTGIALTGLTVGAAVIFFVSRYVLQPSERSDGRGILARLNRSLEKEGGVYLLTLRMAHAPYSVVNWASGVSRIRPWTFIWTTFVGMLPGTCVFVYSGTQMPTLRELVEHGPHSLVHPHVLGALALSGCLPVVSRSLYNSWRYRKRPRHGEYDSSNGPREGVRT